VSDEWRTIDSAPKDGTRIDGWAINTVTGKEVGRFASMWWAGDGWQYGNPNGFYWNIEVPMVAETGEPVVKITHWMPLPEPPKDQTHE
jgi:hypothetical protein